MVHVLSNRVAVVRLVERDRTRQARLPRPARLANTRVRVIRAAAEERPDTVTATPVHQARSRRASGDVAHAGRVGQRTKLLQALVLDLADPLTGDVERTPDLVERPRLPAVEAVAQLEHLALARRERAEDRAQGVAAEGDLGRLVGKRRRLVGEEVPELGLVLVADRLLERDRGLRAAA